MRTIKFRAWDKMNNIWLYANLVDFGKYVDLIDYKTTGQFTGLHDKNGKDIYEGDKVEDGKYIYVIEMYEGCWYAKSKDHNYWIAHIAKSSEVIGNIHE